MAQLLLIDDLQGSRLMCLKVFAREHSAGEQRPAVVLPHAGDAGIYSTHPAQHARAKVLVH